MDLVLGTLGGALAAGQASSVRPALLRVFEAAILPAHRTKFCQYLLWYLCAQVGTRCAPMLHSLLVRSCRELPSSPAYVQELMPCKRCAGGAA